MLNQTVNLFLKEKRKNFKGVNEEFNNVQIEKYKF
jgi:hypothetical protein